MKRFRIYFLILTALSVFCISGCDEIFQSKPEDALNEYLAADLVGDHKKAYSYLSSKNQQNKTLEQYISEKSKHSDSELAKLFIDKTTHKIVNVDIDGSTANIKVDTTTADLNIVTREFANAAFKAASTGKTFQDIQKDIVEKYKKQELPLSNYKSNHKLIKEKDGWKVFLNF